MNVLDIYTLLPNNFFIKQLKMLKKYLDIYSYTKIPRLKNRSVNFFECENCSSHDIIKPFLV